MHVAEGWFSLYHGVDAEVLDDGKVAMLYRAGIVIHDAERPHVVRYRSPEPVLSPETPDECSGVVNDVVFPTGIDPYDDRPRTYDVYYGMADERVGRVRLALG